MIGAIILPPDPVPVPKLDVDPGSVREMGRDLLSASAQADDLGGYASGGARAPSWNGRAAVSYRGGVATLGSRADEMSLALRSVGRRVTEHADELTTLTTDRLDLEGRRTSLLGERDDLERRIRAAEDATPAERQQFENEAAGLRSRFTALNEDIAERNSRVAAENEQMKAAFNAVLTTEQISARWGGVADPADAARQSMPGPDASPDRVRNWWNSLSSEEQQAMLVAFPGLLGNRDGLPAAVRNEANRLRIDRDLATWLLYEEQGVLTKDEKQWLENARSAQDAIEDIEGRTDPVTGEPIPAQVYLYDPSAFGGDGRIAIAAGDLDTADNVAVSVPGMTTDATSAPSLAGDVSNIYEASRFNDPSATTAAMFWVGYDAPDNFSLDGTDILQVAGEGLATEGGERLADTMDGLSAMRSDDPHTTVIGHSYGSTTVGHGAHDHGLATDDIVVIGSPGLGGDTDSAADLGIDPDHVWAGANSRDPVTMLGNHGWLHGETLFGAGLGDDPVEDDFGANRFTAEDPSRGEHIRWFDQHTKYFDHDTESLYNISQIVTGDYGDVISADSRYDPWLDSPQDPEIDRDPTTPATR